jgi:phage terminase large subunit GpA-like protein
MSAYNRHQDAAWQKEIISLFSLSPRQAVVPWLEQHITLPAKMAPNAQGPFRTSGRPYQIPILECWNPDSGVNFCGVSAGTQMLKTTIPCLGLCYRICNSPLPALFVGPSRDWTKLEISEKRLQELINENPILAAHKPADPNMFRSMSMDMDGGGIVLVGGNSPGALAGGSYGIVIIDEASKLVQQASEEAPEAHPFHLAAKRSDGFGSREFHYRSGTPNSFFHPFWQFILLGDQTRFYVQCPHCKNHFYFDFIGRDEDRTEYTENTGIKLSSDYKSVLWDDARDGKGQWNEDKVRESTRYICPHNGCEIREVHKQPLIDACEEKRHNPNAGSNRRSFILPSFYSPTKSFGNMAWDFLSSVSTDFFGLQDYYNSRLARPWQEMAANVKSEDVRKLRDVADYRRNMIPRRPQCLILGADVGDYKTHYAVGAVFDNDEIALIDWGTVLTPEDLIELRKLKYQIAGTDDYMSPAKGLVDSKDQTVRVYNMCQASNGFWFPAAGVDTRTGSWGWTPLKTHATDRYTFNSFAFKKEFYINLIQKQKAPRFYIPRDADEDLIDGLSGQQLLVEKGREAFKKLPNDHYGDACLRIILGRTILRAEQGHGAPDMGGGEEPTVQRDYVLKPS